VVIEKYIPGIQANAEAAKWFKWDDEKYVECEEPEQFSRTINFAM
jgi:hypothetical protein